MRRSIRSSRSLARPYRDLVWIAYLTLPPALGEERRLVLAHRLAAAALARHHGRDPIGLRKALLRRTLHRLITPWAGRLTRMETVPALTRGADVAFTTELDALRPAARAAYALLRMEGRPEPEVRAILAGARVADPAGALAAVAALEARFGDGAAVMFRPAADPTLARCYARPLNRRIRIGLPAVAVVCLLTGLTALSLPEGPETATAQPPPAVAAGAAAPRAITASPGAWRAGTDLDLATWSARGSLTGDRALITRALRAWGRPDGQVLYAGRLDGSTVVLVRQGEQVARYTEDGGAGELATFPAPRPKPDGASPLKLTTTGEGSRYLLPPWVREVSAAPLAGSHPNWRKVRVEDGVTAPVKTPAGKGCWRGPVLRLRAPEIAHGMPYTMVDFGRLSLANAYYQPPPPAEINRYGPSELDTVPGGFTAWKGLGCAMERPEGEIQAATVWEFWRGGLPEGAHGRWVCLRLTDATGGSTVRGVLFSTAGGRTATTLTGDRANSWDCSRLRRDVLMGAWWRAPSGKGYYVAAGSRRVVRITLNGRAVAGASAVSRRRAPSLSGVNELGEKIEALR
ncbi:hypothetical protein FAF44_01410 [Nonomuraea sp. MG754425]|uniref:hypothetical protein n=1 Tax=Nonomuraea sp. MG754425 TaxID=2570319 RepID=UPI001F2271ED|nr:hypothetical protein [Nonomuraea sp. MG754425]MCF6467070.1 hypothetical protein [Nonomuraea sp. MG754425]